MIGFRLSVAVDRSQQEMERYMGLFRSEKVQDRGLDMAVSLRYGRRLLRLQCAVGGREDT
eukprot:scaffold10118_cov148-Amphora_coffeaeformis.AAC.2